MQYLTLLGSKHNFSKDFDIIKSVSSKIDKKLSEKRPIDEKNLDKLSLEELQDLQKIVGIADFMLCRYSDKKEMRSTLKYFVSLISETADSLETLDDEISELIISAEDSINRVKDMHSRISDKSEIETKYEDGPEYNSQETSAINLTKFAIEINTLEYQQNSQEHTIR